MNSRTGSSPNREMIGTKFRGQRIVLALLVLAPPLSAHLVSMSAGELRIEGNRARFELRIPLYEIPHLEDPGAAVLDSVRFTSGGEAPRRLRGTCRENLAEGAYYCIAEYEFSAPVAELEVESALHRITVPNHVHVFRAMQGENRDQAVLDLSMPQAHLRFEPPSAAEVAFRHSGAGFARAVGGWPQLLFLAALALAVRSRREFPVLVGAFLAGQVLAALPMVRGWELQAGFLEAAIALTVAYLAVEILLLPGAGLRWLVVAVLGGFHGIALAQFLEASGYRTAYVLAGAAIGEVALLLPLALGFAKLRKAAPSARPVQVIAVLFLAVSLWWFTGKIVT